MIKRYSTAVWKGGGKSGQGVLTTQSGILHAVSYNYASRFEQGEATNPEELIAAAHAGCFAMKLAFNLEAAGYTAQLLEVTATISLQEGKIIESHLQLKAQVPDIDADKFATLVNDAKQHCPVSRLLNTNIRLTYSLNT